MQNEKLRPWFVDDKLPRHEDYNHMLRVQSAEELRQVIDKLDQEGSRVRMYLGDYELGVVDFEDNLDFYFDMTNTFGNGIFSTLDGIFELPFFSPQIRSRKMDEVIKNECSIADFVYMVLERANLDGVVTDDPRVSAALIREGYMSVLALQDSVHEDSRNHMHDDSVLLIKYSLIEPAASDIEPTVPALPADKENRLWFADANVNQSKDMECSLEINSVEDLLSVVSNGEEPHDCAIVRMYLGRHEIGGITKIPSEKSFYFESSEVWWRENIGARVENLFGTWFEISYEKMEEFLHRELTIEEFVETAMTKRFGVIVTDNHDHIWKLLHEGYRTLCTLDGVLHTKIKNADELRVGYAKDRRVILVKYGLKEIFYSDEECEED